MARHTWSTTPPDPSDPLRTAAFREMAEQTARRRDERAAILSGRKKDVLRQADDAPLTRKYIATCMMPPPRAALEAGTMRECRNHARCIMPQLYPGKMPPGREMMLPSERLLPRAVFEARVKEARRCYLCEIWYRNTYVLRARGRETTLLERPDNYFTVSVKEGEYGEHVMLPCFDAEDTRPTGLVGHVPMFNTEYLRLRELKDPAELLLHGLQDDPKPVYCIEETSAMDFHVVRCTQGRAARDSPSSLSRPQLRQ